MRCQGWCWGYSCSTLSGRRTSIYSCRGCQGCKLWCWRGFWRRFICSEARAYDGATATLLWCKLGLRDKARRIQCVIRHQNWHIAYNLNNRQERMRESDGYKTPACHDVTAHNPTERWCKQDTTLTSLLIASRALECRCFFLEASSSPFLLFYFCLCLFRVLPVMFYISAALFTFFLYFLFSVLFLFHSLSLVLSAHLNCPGGRWLLHNRHS